MPCRFRRSMMVTAAAAAVAVLCLMTARPIAGQAGARVQREDQGLGGLFEVRGRGVGGQQIGQQRVEAGDRHPTVALRLRRLHEDR